MKVKLLALVLLVVIADVAIMGCVSTSTEDVSEKDRLRSSIEAEYTKKSLEDYSRMVKGFAAMRKWREYPDVLFLQNSLFSMDSLRCQLGNIRNAHELELYLPDLHVDPPWTNVIRSRRGISRDDSAKGDSMLNEFAIVYMPNTYVNFEKSKERVLEVQQIFNEEFPRPWEIEKTNAKWGAFEKVLRALIDAKVNYFRVHDELCHFYLMHKVCALSAEELALADNEGMPVRLLGEMPYRLDLACPSKRLLPLCVFPLKEVNEGDWRLGDLDEASKEFASKSMPETYAIYQKCLVELEDTRRLFDEIAESMRLMDIVKFELSVIGCREKIDFLVNTLNTISLAITGCRTEYRIMARSSDDIAKFDHETAMKWKGFCNLLPGYLHERAKGPIIAVNSEMNAYYPCNILKWYHVCAAMEPNIPETFKTSWGTLEKIAWAKDVVAWADKFDPYLPTHETGQATVLYGHIIERPYENSYSLFGKEVINHLNAMDEGKATYLIRIPSIFTRKHGMLNEEVVVEMRS